MRLAGWPLAVLLLGAHPLAAAVLCPAAADRFPAFAGSLLLPPAERAFEAGEAADNAALLGFLEANEGLVAYLELAVERAEPPAEPACAGNLESVETGEILLRFGNSLVIVGDLAGGAPQALCQPDFEGFRLRGFFLVAPPPPVASLRAHRLTAVSVDALAANRTVVCLRRAAP